MDMMYTSVTPLLTLLSCRVWRLLVLLHRGLRGEPGGLEGPWELGALWTNHPNPCVAYGFVAVPLSGWKEVTGGDSVVQGRTEVLFKDLILICADYRP